MGSVRCCCCQCNLERLAIGLISLQLAALQHVSWSFIYSGILLSPFNLGLNVSLPAQACTSRFLRALLQKKSSLRQVSLDRLKASGKALVAMGMLGAGLARYCVNSEPSNNINSCYYKGCY